MPIEIKELVIRAIAVKTDADPKKGLSKAAKAAMAAAPTTDRDNMVQDCVREVMRILREQGER
jgi:hypothetical protein